MKKTMSLDGGLDMYSFPMKRYGNGDSPEGRRVRYLDENGYDGDRIHARKFFEKDAILTVQEIYVGRSSSDVSFIEHPGHKFNTVMFEDVE
jgi:hypothetical protein